MLNAKINETVSPSNPLEEAYEKLYKEKTLLRLELEMSQRRVAALEAEVKHLKLEIVTTCEKCGTHVAEDEGVASLYCDPCWTNTNVNDRRELSSSRAGKRKATS